MALTTFVAGQVLTAAQLNGSYAAVGGLRLVQYNTFSAVSSVSLPNDSFTSSFQNYKVLFVVTAASSDNQASLRFRTAGTDNTGASYHGSWIGEAAGSGITADTNGGTSMALGWIPTTTPRVSLMLDVFAPQETAATTVSGQFVGMNSNWTVNATMNGGGYFAGTTVFDSLSLIPGAGTITGNYRVYAYAQTN